MTAPKSSNRPADAEPEVREEAIEQRANLLPEEAAAGSDDPRRQAEVILEESAARILNGGKRYEAVERRTSADTVEPPADA
jgi:hypothetical protein